MVGDAAPGRFGPNRFLWPVVRRQVVDVRVPVSRPEPAAVGRSAFFFALEAALGGIILEQVSEIIRWHDIADGDDLDILTDQTLFNHGPENQTADPSKPINSNFHWHIFRLS